MKARTASGKRPTRVAELLRERIASILLYKCADPRLHDLTVTEVEMSPDLKIARVFYVVREGVEASQVKAGLDKALGFIRQELAREHLLRTMPELIFQPDIGFERADRLEKLLHGLAATEGKEK
ncbi:MAG: 30S ribosome-binding factor RbfA [Deltaproteobacteria bacterium]|nr:30S ribosome-binding factor RbfA [Deltaproteobacteria bacterium]